MKKFLSLLLSFTLFVPNLVINVNATNSPNFSEIIESNNEGDELTITVIDESISNSNTISPNALVTEVYRYSTYTYISDSRTATNVGPRKNDRLIVSVARGESITINKTYNFTASIIYQSGIDAALEELINLKFNATASGSLSFTETISQQFSLASTSDYSSLSFYICLNYDKYNVTVKRIDYYDYVDSNGKVTGSFSSAPYNYTINNVKIPRIEKYSIGSY